MTDGLILAAVLAGAALGVALVVGFNRFVGGWTPARLPDAEFAGARLAEAVLGFEPGEGVVAADGRAALVMEAGGARLGLVAARGDRYVARAFRPGELKTAEVSDADLRLDPGDFTLAAVTVRFADPDLARAWAERARAFVRPAGAEAPGSAPRP